MHHRRPLDVAGIAVEGLYAGVGFIKLVGPGTVEVDGIHQHSHVIGAELVDDARYHAVGLSLTPAVEIVYRRSFAKVAAGHLGIVEVLHLGHIVGVETRLLVYGDAVCHIDAGLAVQTRCLVNERLADLVERIHLTVVYAEGLHDFGTGSAVGAVGEHRHEIRHADGRNHLGVHARLGTHQVERHAVDAPQSRLLGVGEYEILAVEFFYFHDLTCVHVCVFGSGLLAGGTRAEAGHHHDGGGYYIGCLVHLCSFYYIYNV